jgi:hypothetical protein
MAEECCKTNIFASAVSTVKDLAKDSTLAAEATRQTRVEMCERCDKFRSATRQCSQCGCFVDMKARFQVMQCPLGKW